MVKITVYVEAVNKQKMFTIEQWGKPFENFFVESYAAFENPNFFSNFIAHCHEVEFSSIQFNVWSMKKLIAC